MLADHATHGTGRDAEFACNTFFAPVVGAKSAGQLALVDAADVQLAIMIVARYDAPHLDAFLADAIGEFVTITFCVHAVDLRYDLVAELAIVGLGLVVGDLFQDIAVLTLCVFVHRFMICLTNIIQGVPKAKSAMEHFLYLLRRRCRH